MSYASLKSSTSERPTLPKLVMPVIPRGPLYYPVTSYDANISPLTYDVSCHKCVKTAASMSQSRDMSRVQTVGADCGVGGCSIGRSSSFYAGSCCRQHPLRNVTPDGLGRPRPFR
ncbi:hypothetical protein NITHO_1260002 [Nitrolancea hollandica Lb]|uniref:Uncharacterized protein n=1 Tax=Nitrolancea hollandica Lb TaxID=1129897 RepID=I4ECV7_9BACT|nr:hypothetical protein NITHO_1260002 [Nitrolancea hollandica Lb]